MKPFLFPAAGILALAACASTPMGDRQPTPSSAEVDQVTAILKRDFHDKGPAKLSRFDLDDVQRACNMHADNPPAELAKSLQAEQMKRIVYPSDGLMGDWKAGEKIAASGRGMTWKDKPGVPGGGSCYNCHQLSPKQPSYGTLGPSLTAFAKKRGNGIDVQRYVYGKIYNAKAFNVCSIMPRLGTSHSLSEQQIKDVTAYLLDPASPVNQ